MAQKTQRRHETVWRKFRSRPCHRYTGARWPPDNIFEISGPQGVLITHQQNQPSTYEMVGECICPPRDESRCKRFHVTLGCHTTTLSRSIILVCVSIISPNAPYSSGHVGINYELTRASSEHGARNKNGTALSKSPKRNIYARPAAG